MADTYSDQIWQIACDTFETICYMFPLERDEAVAISDISAEMSNVRSAISFEGATKGMMVIWPSYGLLDAMAANMLGVEDPSPEEKEGALCEIANIICGNTVPLFANGARICYLNPPRLLTGTIETEVNSQSGIKESVNVYLDEGIAEISIYFTVK